MPKEKIVSDAGGSVISKLPTRQPRIIEKRFTSILESLYRSIINNWGMFATIKMETHAPQIKYYPGSPYLEEEIHLGQEAMFPPLERKETQVIMPRSSKHLLWLWTAISHDTQDLSENIYPSQCKIFADHPEFYSRDVIDIPPLELGKILKQKDNYGKYLYKIGEEKVVVARWQRCYRTLFEEFDGDPIKLLKETGWSVESTFKWKMKQKKLRGYDPIPGWGRKILSLYFLYIADLGYNLPDDAFPADLHAQALLIQTNCLDWGDSEVIYSNKLAEMIRKFVSNLCKEKNWDVILLGHAQWLRGSFLCNGCSSNILVPSLCEIYEKCGGRVDTGSYTAGKWYKNNRIQTKGGERPEFGLPTEHPPRMSRARKMEARYGITVPKTIPLFFKR